MQNRLIDVVIWERHGENAGVGQSVTILADTNTTTENAVRALMTERGLNNIPNWNLARWSRGEEGSGRDFVLTSDHADIEVRSIRRQGSLPDYPEFITE